MDSVNIKIGNNVYNGVSTINVDKVGGGSANFVYEGIKSLPLLVTTNISTTNRRSSINYPIFNTSIERGI